MPLSGNFRRITQVLQAADAACYAAKDQGRNRVHVYQEDDAVVAQRHGEMQWVARVKRALNENRFLLEAQPIVPIQDTATRASPRHERTSCSCACATGRQHRAARRFPAGGRALQPVAAPGSLGDLDTRCSGWRRIRRRPQRIARVYVNLSGDSVGDPQLHDFIRAALDETRVPPTKIGFEITETAAIGNLTRANQLIAELRRLGCAFSLDDFGSGVSSFAYLKALTVDWLKIDGLFVGNIVHDRIDYEMVRSITDIGHVMGKKVVAESVESAAVLERLKQIGVDYAQGLALGAPGRWRDGRVGRA